MHYKDEMQVIWNSTDALNRAFYNQNPGIRELPRDILDKLSRCCSSVSPLSELDIEIEKML